MGREVKTGLVYEGVDRGATKTMKSVESGANGLRQKLGGMSKHVEKMPDAFGKSAAAMMMMQGATAQMGGGAADAANKLTALVALAATGGPLGIAIAAATGLVAALSKGYEVLTTKTRNFESAMKSLEPVTKAMSERMRSVITDTKDLKEELRDFGKTSSQIMQDQIAWDKAGIESNKQMIADDRERIRVLSGLYKLTENMGFVERERLLAEHDLAGKSREDLAQKAILLGKQVENTKKANDIRERRIEQAQVQLELAAKERAAIDAKEAAERRHNAAIERRRAKQAETAAEALAQFEWELEQANQAIIARQAQADAIVAIEQNKKDRIAAINDKMDKDLAEARDKDAELVKQKEEAELSSAKQKAAAVQATTTAILQQAAMEAQGARNTAEKVEAFARSSAKQVIDILATRAAAAAMEKAVEQLGMPWGAVVGAAASIAAFGVVAAIKTKLAAGGIVPGAQTGRDTVPAMLMPGEAVASTRQTDALRSFVTMLAGERVGRNVADMSRGLPSGGGETAQSGGGGAVIFNVSQQFPDRLLSRRQFRRDAQEVRKLQRRGMWLARAPA